MITIKVDRIEVFDNATQMFTYREGGVFEFEYSLKAIADWEAIYGVPFFKTNLSGIPLLNFCKAMSLSDDLEDWHLTPEVVNKLKDYMQKDMTPTVISQNGDQTPSSSYETAETMYATMFLLRMPLECEYWNLYRLLNTMRVMSIRMSPNDKKLSTNQIMAQNNDLNRARKKALNSKG